jgi:hypothetical protein
MVRRVEKRWLSMDVKAYILAVFLHPGFHGKGFNLSKISLLTLTGIVVDFYKTFFGEDSPGISEVRSQFAKYINYAAPYEKSLMTEFKNFQCRIGIFTHQIKIVKPLLDYLSC